MDSCSIRAIGGGEYTGPNPVDRGKPGTKRCLLVDRVGTPLAVVLAPANLHDSKLLEPTLDRVPAVNPGRPGRPRFRPDKLHADKGFDYPRCRRACRQRGITPRIARRGLEPRDRLGRHRWVVERTLSWLSGFHRLRVRFERRVEVHLALTLLACVLICVRQLST